MRHPGAKHVRGVPEPGVVYHCCRPRQQPLVVHIMHPHRIGWKIPFWAVYQDHTASRAANGVDHELVQVSRPVDRPVAAHGDDHGCWSGVDERPQLGGRLFGAVPVPETRDVRVGWPVRRRSEHLGTEGINDRNGSAEIPQR